MLWLNGAPLSLEEVVGVAKGEIEVKLSDSARERMSDSRRVVEGIVSRGDTVYGINTGFGKLSDFTVPNDRLKQLQLNLVRSHACGVGDPLSPEETRVLMLLRANVLAAGYSGARPEVADQILALLNADVLPQIPSRGSVGASGDLAPLAHLALGLIGEGASLVKGDKKSSKQALKDAGIEPLELQAKEGLALINGTQAMGAVGLLALVRAKTGLQTATLAGAISLEALLGTPAAFDPRISQARRHEGQIRTAAMLSVLLQGSEIRESHRNGDPRVQDAYCLRCMPQVHGAVWTVLNHVLDILTAETGAATDNPLVFAETGDVVSGGNFHGAPLAYALDYAAIALTDLASICERRIDRLINPDLNEGLPPFLTHHSGESSGFMIAHVAAAALLSECKVLAHPASVDSVPTSGGKEDHVSMGMTSANKLIQIVTNLERVIAIELLAAVQAIEFRRPLKSSTGIEKAIAVVRSLVPKLEEDRSMSFEIQLVANAIRGGELLLPV